MNPGRFIREKLREFRSRSSAEGSPVISGSPGEEEEKHPEVRVGASPFKVGQSLIPEGEGVKLRLV